jgi:hypothetical protein
MHQPAAQTATAGVLTWCRIAADRLLWFAMANNTFMLGTNVPARCHVPQSHNLTSFLINLGGFLRSTTRFWSFPKGIGFLRLSELVVDIRFH